MMMETAPKGKSSGVSNESYKEHSFIPNKAGELVEAIHLTLVCRALRRYTGDREVQNILIGHGLLVHKVTGMVHFKVELGKAGMKVLWTVDPRPVVLIC